MGHGLSASVQLEAERLYNSLDTHGRGYITTMDLILHDYGQNRRKARVIQNALHFVYSQSMLREHKLPKNQFIDMYIQRVTGAKARAALRKRAAGSTRGKGFGLDAFLCEYMENKGISADIMQYVTNVALSNTNKEVEMLSRLGINSRSSLHILYRPEFFTDTVTEQFVTIENVSKIVDYLSIAGIDVGRALSSSFTDMVQSGVELHDAVQASNERTVCPRATPDDRSQRQKQRQKVRKKNIPMRPESTDGSSRSENQLATRVMREYDYTKTGYLNEHEFSHFIKCIKREIEAHALFMGTDMKEIGPYITGRTLGFGRGGIVKVAIRKDVLLKEKTKQMLVHRRSPTDTTSVASETKDSQSYASPDAPPSGKDQDAVKTQPNASGFPSVPNMIGRANVTGDDANSASVISRKRNRAKNNSFTVSAVLSNLPDTEVARLQSVPSIDRPQLDVILTPHKLYNKGSANTVPTSAAADVDQPPLMNAFQPTDITLLSQVAIKLIPCKPPAVTPSICKRKVANKRYRSVISETDNDTDGSIAERTDGAINCSEPTAEAVHCIEPVALARVAGHDNIIELLDTFHHTDARGNTWTAMVMTLCGGGSLNEYRANTVVTEPMVRYFFFQIMSAVLYMHLHGVAHMDLRLENCLLDNNCAVRICDFGNAMSFPVDEVNSASDTVKRGTIAGTLANMPPEMISLQSEYSAKKVDIWCCGLILYELLTAKPAFGAPSKERESIRSCVSNRKSTHLEDEINKKICSNICGMKYEPLGFNYSEEARDLCSRMMAYDPADRPDAYEVLRHSWMRQEMIRPALARGMLILDPAPQIARIQHYLEQLLALENIDTKRPKDRDKDRKQAQPPIKLLCTHNATKMVFLITGEVIHSGDKLGSLDFELGYIYNIMQSNTGNTVAENEYIRRVQIHESVFKLAFYLKTGLMWDFQRLFRRIRYCILNAFSTSASQGNEAFVSDASTVIDDTPACVRVEPASL